MNNTKGNVQEIFGVFGSMYIRGECFMIARGSRGACFAQITWGMVTLPFVFPVIWLIDMYFPGYLKIDSFDLSGYIVGLIIIATMLFVAAYQWSRDFYLSIHENILICPGNGKLETLDLNNVAKAIFTQNFYQRPFNSGSLFFKMRGWRRRRGFTNIEDPKALMTYMQEHYSFPVIDEMKK